MAATFRWVNLGDGLRCLLGTCPIAPRNPTELQLIDWDEIRTFKTQKRSDEHLSARWLLEQALHEWGDIDCSQINVARTEERAPYLEAIQGLWIQPKLPNISITHSENLACVVLIDQDWTVGIDAEPLTRPPKPSVFDMMAKGRELSQLHSGALDALWTWTAKEAIQKAARLGMHLNPRDIDLTSFETENKIPIGKFIFQLKNLSNEDYQITLAWGRDMNPIRTKEDDLLDETREAMNASSDWKVGCSTVRKNA